MDIFIQRLPTQATWREVQNRLDHVLRDLGIETYHIDKRRGKPFGKLSILDTYKAQLFLFHYGVPRNSAPFVQPRSPLMWNNTALRMWEDRYEMSSHARQSLELQASQRASGKTEPRREQYQTSALLSRFETKGLECGMWENDAGHLAFTPFFEDVRSGTIVFGTQQAVVLLQDSRSSQQRLYFAYHNIENIVLGSYQDPTVTFQLRVAPKLYQDPDSNDIAAALSALNLQPSTNGREEKKLRLPCLNEAHAKAVESCFVYQLALRDRFQISDVRTLLSRNPRIPATTSLNIPTTRPSRPLHESFNLLGNDLTDQYRYGQLPFALLFQITALARNGIMHPQKVRALLPKIAEILRDHRDDKTLAAVRRFVTQILSPGPGVDPSITSTASLKQLLDKCADDYDRFPYDPKDPYRLARRYRHINLIHKIVVTPTGTYLHGPYPEPTNRVLRKYEDHIDHFARMVFEDEDGGSVRYDSRADQRLIYDRFKQILEGSVVIAGRAFSFLGFSHSSLRAQSVWCMSPMVLSGTLQLPEHILRALGNFTNIRVPAKCAARIGQNFTDTNATIQLRSQEVGTLPMIVRNGRDFADGVGSMSEEMARDVCDVYGARRHIKPRVFQIRFQGYKGMVSVNPSLRGRRLMLRDNMKKFDAPSAWYLEICGAGFRPLPMLLNRQLIKIPEDLGIGRQVFESLQSAAVDHLRFMTQSTINTASFLEQADTTRATRLPFIIRKLGK